MSYEAFHRRSIVDPESFWRDEAQHVYWQREFDQVLDATRLPHARWFVGGTTNLCFNAVDRWSASHPQRDALVYYSAETSEERRYSFKELLSEVTRVAAMLLGLGVGPGDRVLIYMPMVPEAVFAMLACTRIGAVHSVVFGGFASASLAARIDDASPSVILTADAGSRAGRVIAYKPLLDEALRVARHQPLKVVLLDRGLAPHDKQSGRDLDWAGTVRQVADRDAPVCWLESNAPSYILYTSGTTGRPKGVLRDTGGYAVALATSMRYIFEAQAGDVFFATSDIGWVVGHSYIVYGPLIAGMTTVLCEGLPTHPDPGVWWRTVDRFRVNRLFSSPTAIRVLKKFGDAPIRQSDLGSLRGVYLAGEPLDQPTSQWIADALEVPVTDNYWQTETGWPILALPRGVTDAAGARPPRLGSPGVAMPGFDVKVIPETGTAVCADGDKGIVMIAAPLPPGCMQSVWGDDARFLETYWSRPLADDRWYYSTFDWGVKDGDGYHFILGRTDDVINVAGHRLGTREIEECLCAHALVAEAAVVGVKDEIKGQVAVAFVVLRQTDAPLPDLEKELLTTVDRQLGPVARPARVHRVSALPKTRSGKVLRRVIQALCEGRDAGDVATLEDPSAVAAIAAVVGQPAAHAAWST